MKMQIRALPLMTMLETVYFHLQKNKEIGNIIIIKPQIKILSPTYQEIILHVENVINNLQDIVDFGFITNQYIKEFSTPVLNVNLR